jgi:predicted metal-binding membrane protein
MKGMPMPEMMSGMHGTPMSGITMALPLFVVMMAAMMLPSAVPAIVRRACDSVGVLAGPLFVGCYLGVWALAGLATWLLYQPPGPAASGALLIGDGRLRAHAAEACVPPALPVSASARAPGSAPSASARASG